MIKQIIVFVMLFLVLSISPVFALQIGLSSVSGSDGVDGYARAEDDLTVNVEVLADTGENYSAEDVASNLYFSSFVFDSCDRQIDRYLCTLLYQDFDAGLARSFPYVIGLEDPQTGAESTRSFDFYIDDYAPVVSLGDVSQNGGDVLVDVRVQDRAYATAPTGVCSGLVSVELSSQDGTSLGAGDVDGCVFDDDIVFSSSALGTGEHVLCVRAIDVFGYTAESCTSVTVDADVPVIEDIRLFNAFGEVDYIGASTQASIEFILVEHQGVFTVDLTNDGSKVDAKCLTISSGRYNCTTGLVTFTPGNHTLEARVVDTSGNEGSNSVVLNVLQDSTNPEVTFLGSSVIINGTSYLSDQVQIFARFAETQSGFDGNEVYVKLPTGEVLQTDACENGWECSWQDFEAGSSGAGTLVLQRAQDDAGNAVTAQVDVIIDNDAPIVSFYELYSLTNSSVRVPFAFSSAPVFIAVNYTDEALVTGVANFSVVGGGLVDGNCAEGSCLFQSNEVSDEFVFGAVPIELTDSLGNVANFSVDVEVLEINATANLWQHTAIVNPGAFDRSIFELINNYAYVEIDFSSADAQMLDVSLDGCRSGLIGSEGNASEPIEGTDIQYVQDIELVEFDAASEVQLLKVTMKATDVSDVDELFLTCDMLLSSRTDTVFVPEEVETVPFSLQFFGTPGGIDEELEEEIEDAIEEATEGIVNQIAALEEWVDWARKACQTVQVVFNVVGALLIAYNVYKQTGNLLKALVFTAPLGQNSDTASCLIAESNGQIGYAQKTGWVETVQNICDFISCRFSLTGWLWNDVIGLGDEANFQGLQNTLYNIGGGGLVDLSTDKLANRPIDSNNDGTLSSSEQNRGAFASNKGIFGHEAYTGTEDSIVWSVINLCIPGIIKNLNEYRQVKCRYALCLRDDVAQGVPKSACDSLKSYMMCKYIWGEVFAAIPFINFLDNILSQLKEAFSTPTGVLGFVLHAACNLFITDACTGPGYLYSTCATLETVSAIGEIVATVNNILAEDAWDLGAQDLCKELE